MRTVKVRSSAPPGWTSRIYFKNILDNKEKHQTIFCFLNFLNNLKKK